MESWKKITESYAYRGWRQIIRRRFRLPDGREADFDILSAGHYVTVAAVTEADEMLLVRQYRPGPEKILLSFPEGGIDEGELPEEAARRELLEETGYTARRLRLLRTFHSSYTNQQQFCMLATGCRPIGRQQLDQDEFIEVTRMPIREFRTFLRDPVNDHFSNVGTAYLALDQLNKL